MDIPRLLLILLATVPGAIVCGSLFYLLVLLSAAFLPTRRSVPSNDSGSWPSLAVVIPAHDEEMVLAATLHSLQQQDYPQDRFDVVVIADNCTDTTAEIAREWGTRVVLERTNTAQRGKGYALEWAFAQLLAPQSSLKTMDACIIVDADTQLAPDFLSVIARRLRHEAKGAGVSDSITALQGRYGVLNPHDGWRAALMTAAFDLCNHIRLLGASNLGLSVGLKGNGMAFTRALLKRARWQGRSITEDIDYGLSLLLEHNVKVGYEPAARVWAQMPTEDAPAASQRERWERGRYRLLIQHVPVLLKESLRRFNLPLFAAAADLTIPPLAELLGLLCLWGIAAGVGIYLKLFTLAWLWVWAVAAVSFVIYVLAGLLASGASYKIFLALLYVPVYVVWKLALYLTRFVSGPLRRRQHARLASGASNSEEPNADDWIRTERTPLAPGSVTVSTSNGTSSVPVKGTAVSPAPLSEEKSR